MTPLTAEKLAELERLLAEINTRSDGDYLSRLANGERIATNCATFLRDNGPAILSLAKRVAGAPVAIITESGDDWIAYNGSEPEAFAAIIDKRVALVEIVGGEE